MNAIEEKVIKIRRNEVSRWPDSIKRRRSSFDQIALRRWSREWTRHWLMMLNKRPILGLLRRHESSPFLAASEPYSLFSRPERYKTAYPIKISEVNSWVMSQPQRFSSGFVVEKNRSEVQNTLHKYSVRSTVLSNNKWPYKLDKNALHPWILQAGCTVLIWSGCTLCIPWRDWLEAGSLKKRSLWPLRRRRRSFKRGWWI